MPFFSLRAARALLTAATLAGVLLAGAAGARAATPYQNPFNGEQPYVGRTDMGVDLCLSPGDPIRAIGDGVVTGIIRNWDGREPYVWYEDQRPLRGTLRVRRRADYGATPDRADPAYR